MLKVRSWGLILVVVGQIPTLSSTDADEGCRSESVDCIDDRGFEENDYDG